MSDNSTDTPLNKKGRSIRIRIETNRGNNNIKTNGNIKKEDPLE